MTRFVQMDPAQLALDTARVLLQRSLFSHHLAKKPGAMSAIVAILKAAVEV